MIRGRDVTDLVGGARVGRCTNLEAVMLRRTVARTLARTLLAVVITQTALGGCQAHRERAPGAGSAPSDVGDVIADDSAKAEKNQPTSPIAAPTETSTKPTGTTTPTPTPTLMPPPPPSPDRTAAADPATGVITGASAGSGSGSASATATGGAIGYGIGGGKGNLGPASNARYAVAQGSLARRPMVSPGRDDVSGEGYKDYGQNAWTDASKDRLSTFAADVDTASYTIARRKLTEGALPPAAAVRVEEFVNYFHYDYAAPAAGQPFAVHIDATPSPFNPGREIVRVGVTTKVKSLAERKPMRLTFLVDVSGSMQSADKLDLAKRSLRILVDNLKDGDTVALVTYAGSTRVVLPATGLERKNEILAAIEDLTAGGSTAMASGLDLAYEQAMKGLGSGVESRVIVLSDGDANVGRSSHAEILSTIAGKVKEGVTLSTIGFGMGNYKDETMEQLANKGNGNNFYIDGLSQAKRVFQQQLGSTLEVVAQDVKLQVDFEPARVARYRLIGYENRDVADTDFRNDAVDAGEIGAGHQVTAVYEIEPARTTAALSASDPLLTVRVRHKEPKGTKASERAFTFAADQVAHSFASAPEDLRFAFAVAAFADVLRGAEDAEHWDLAQLQAIASQAAGSDADRKELVALVQRARDLRGGSKTARAAIAE
jgi:Ca-activated chloride channel family protein